jgi:hypothetical protein
VRLPLALLLIGQAAALGQNGGWGPAPASQPAYTLIYTGRLFGYYRYPDEQATTQTGCPAFADALASPQVRLMLTTLTELRRSAAGPQVFVSMGDDFAPELLARAMRDQEPGSPNFGNMLMKDLFETNASGDHWESAFETGQAGLSEALNSGKVPSDNVACLMRLAGINSMVPGEQDFAFGADRVRELARFLAEPGTGDYKPVQMLAANLAIVSSVHKPEPPLPSNALPARIRDALVSRAGVSIDLPAQVMPWLQRVSVTTPETVAVFDCPADPENPRDFKLPSEAGSACTPVQRHNNSNNEYALAKPAHASANFLSYYTLDPGTNHAICAEYSDKTKENVFCKLFSVAYPFLQYRPDSPGTTPAPYYLSTPEAGSPAEATAVFGVMDPTLIGYVGQFHYTFANRASRFDTKLQIGDPVEAVRQILALCSADESCARARKIVLAQMPVVRALQLAAEVKGIDLIVAQADYEHATETENRSRPISSSAPAYVLAPGFSFDPHRDVAMSLNLRRADVYFAKGEQDAKWEYLANHVYDQTVPPVSQHSLGIEAGEIEELQRATAKTVASPVSHTAAENYESLALLAIQQFCGSDVALLQRRDIFSDFAKAIAYWPANHQYGEQQLLDEILWKGDFAFCLPVKGSTLKKMLKDSANFDSDDLHSLSLQTEKGRGLSTLGIETPQTSSDPPLIRGQPVEDNKLYGVAMTDYLAFGDTGYPELTSEAVLPRVRITSVGILHRLTGLACKRLPGTGACPDNQPIDSFRYFQPVAQLPFDTTPGLTAAEQLRRWATSALQPQRDETTLFESAPLAPETAVRRRGAWWFSLENLSVEYDLSFIRGSDQAIPANFSGINTFSQLSAPESSRIGLWTRARGGYLFPRWFEFYASGEEKFTYSAVRIPNASGNGGFGPYQATLTDNLLRAEVGLLSKPLSKKVPVRLLLSENLLTQLADPFLELLETPPCNSPGCVPQATIYKVNNLGRNDLVMTRLGARFENPGNSRWFEAGRQYGENVGVPVGYSIQGPGRSQPFSCTLAGNLSLTECLSADPLFNTQSTVLANLQNQPVAGWFLNFHAVVPLYQTKLQLTLDNYAELFDRRAADTTFDTRFYEDVTMALKFPIWGNLTFAPQVEVFFFQNKVIPGQALLTNHYTFVSSSLKLEYNFDWHRGVGILRALRYPQAQSPATPSP